MESPDNEQGSSLFDSYFAFIVKWKKFVLLFWFVLLVLGANFGPHFMHACQLGFIPPKGTEADKADAFSRAKYPNNGDNLIVMMTANGYNQSILGNATRDFSLQLAHDLLVKFPDWIYSVAGYYPVLAQDPDLDQLANFFLSADHTVTFLSANFRFRSKLELADFIDGARNLVRTTPTPPSFTTTVTGFSVLNRDVQVGVADDMESVDAYIFPVSLAVLAYVLRSLRLMLIPLVTVLTSLLVSFAIMYPIALYQLDVVAFTPSVMLSLTLALSIDYSLFLLTRYRREVERGLPDEQAVKEMSRHAGRVVMVSGFTLALTFVALIFFPLIFLQTIGLGASVAILMTIFVNLTFTPAALLTFSTFFRNFDTPTWLLRVLYTLTCGLCGRARVEDTPESQKLTSSTSSSYQASEMKSPFLAQEPGEQEHHDSWWYRSAMWITDKWHPYLVMALVLAAMLPLGVQVAYMNLTFDATEIFPHNSQSLISLRQMQKVFIPGRTSPYHLMIEVKGNQTVMSDAFFTASQNLCQKLLDAKLLPATSITGISYSAGQTVPFMFAQNFLNPSSPFFNMPQAKEWRNLYFQQTSPDNTTSTFLLETPFNPLSNDARPFIQTVRKILKDNPDPNCNYYLNGGAVDFIDSTDTIMSMFGLVVGCTVVVVFTIAGLAFRSVFVPFRLVISIALPVCFIYGLASLVFGPAGIFNWMFPSLKEANPLFWLVPVMSFSVLIGLALDYDLFLFSRIAEFRSKGHSDRHSIVLGVHETGGIITAAGIIMAIAFAGLLLANEIAMIQFGFLLSFSVLIDTFVIRTCFVPALIMVAGRWNWWPRAMPEPDHSKTFF